VGKAAKEPFDPLLQLPPSVVLPRVPLREEAIKCSSTLTCPDMTRYMASVETPSATICQHVGGASGGQEEEASRQGA